jgi:hypothetical protein
VKRLNKNLEDTGKQYQRNEKNNKYEKIDLTKVYQLALLGMTNEELAKFFGVSDATWSCWLNGGADKIPGLLEAIIEGREGVYAKIADRLAQRAMGFTHKSKKVHYDAEIGEFVEHDIEVVYPPSEAAGMWMLKNGRPQNWKDKTIVEGPNGEAVSQPVVNIITSDDKIKKLMEDELTAKNQKNEAS